MIQHNNMRTTLFSKQKLKFLISFSGIISIIIMMAVISGCGDKVKKDNPYSAVPGFDSAKYNDVLKARFNKEKDTFRICHDHFEHFDSLAIFYQKRNYAPFWTNTLPLSSKVDSIIGFLKKSDEDGLSPNYYDQPFISAYIHDYLNKSKLEKEINYSVLANIELMISNGVVNYCHDLKYGVINPKDIDPDGYSLPNKIPLPGEVFTPLFEKDILAYINSIQPKALPYLRLKKELKRMMELEKKSDTTSIPQRAENLKEGDTSKLVHLIAQKLMITRALDPLAYSKKVFREFDITIIDAISRFQENNNLVVDGKLNEVTRKNLNISVAKRIDKIKVNMERLRWFCAPTAEPCIKVNLAAFQLQTYIADTVVNKINICCGKKREWGYEEKFKKWLKTRRKMDEPKNLETPTMTGPIMYLVLNPTWDVPKNIAEKEMIFDIWKDSLYLKKQGFKVYLKDSLVDPSKVNWKKYSPTHMPFRFSQEPGAFNALGKIKFIFRNPFSIYLHDTPKRAPFRSNYRAVSHGCMRVEEPLELGEFVLKYGKMSMDIDDVRILVGMKPEGKKELKYKLQEKLKQWKKHQETMAKPGFKKSPSSHLLKKQIMVYVDYITCWVDEDGTMQYRDDHYDKDKAILRALNNYSLRRKLSVEKNWMKKDKDLLSTQKGI
ncbi:MAG: L,D-transpeptidase family protein [Bacteroidota bacterium]